MQSIIQMNLSQYKIHSSTLKFQFWEEMTHQLVILLVFVKTMCPLTLFFPFQIFHQVFSLLNMLSLHFHFSHWWHHVLSQQMLFLFIGSGIFFAFISTASLSSVTSQLDHNWPWLTKTDLASDPRILLRICHISLIFLLAQQSAPIITFPCLLHAASGQDVLLQFQQCLWEFTILK